MAFKLSTIYGRICYVGYDPSDPGFESWRIVLVNEELYNDTRCFEFDFMGEAVDVPLPEDFSTFKTLYSDDAFDPNC